MTPRKRTRIESTGDTRENSTEQTEVHPSDPHPPHGGHERAFRCHFCTKAFHRKEHLQRHERLHTKEKPFQCTTCSAGFARRDLLARHLRLVHESGSPSQSETHLTNSGGDPGSSSSRVVPEGLDGDSPDGPRALFNTTGDILPGQSSNVNEFISFSPSSARFATPHGSATMIPFTYPATTLDMPPTQPTNGFGDFDLFIDSINGTYGSGLSSFYVDQPILPSPPAPLFPSAGSQTQLHAASDSSPGSNNVFTSEPRLFDEFTSTLPSFETSQTQKLKEEPWKITQRDWDCILVEVQKFNSKAPKGFFLPSRHTMTRYITTYFAGFHRHLPFIHYPTFSVVKCPVELLLAMATIGAISAFDRNNATMLFRASFAISQERLLRRKRVRRKIIFHSKAAVSPGIQLAGSPNGLPSATETADRDTTLLEEQVASFDPLPLAQTLLILMAMATWGNSEAIFDEAIDIQNILANYLRTEHLLEPQVLSESTNWSTWVLEERFRRTVAIIFCFFIFHTIVYDIPSPILNSDLKIHLPCREKDWEARTEDEWQQARTKHEPELHFQQAFSGLFPSQRDEVQTRYSSLGGYTLVLALIQHIYFLRTVAKRRPEGEQCLSTADMTEVERALRKWQSGWNQDPESFLGPGSPLGPISFNSTALLRMAYIRLNVDLGPWRALDTHIPDDIAASMDRSPPLATNRRLTRAVLYSAHALSIPVKIGINIVAHNQAFSWSLQHSLCALECAFIISKWLIAIQPHVSEGTIDEEEARLYVYIQDMVTEAEAGGDIESPSSNLCTRVVRIWARILSGTAHWTVVPLIGKTLEAYASILESRLV